MREIYIRINGIECSACVVRLREVLGALKGVEQVEINSVTAQSYIVYDEDMLSVEDLESCIRKNGYHVPIMKAEVTVKNICKNQEEQIQNCLSAINGVKEVDCDLEKNQVNISYLAVGISSKNFVEALAGLGLEGTVLEVHGGEEDQIYIERLFRLRLLIESTFLTMPLFWNPSPIIQMIFATIIQLGPGRFFYKGAWKSIRNKSLTMDFLIAVSTSIIYGYSAYIVFTVHDDIQLYFLGEGVLMSILLLGKYLEILVKSHSGQLIRELLRLQPQKAIVEQEGIRKEVDVDNLRVGNMIRVLEGARIPVDGRIIDGQCVVDESMLTGESQPIRKKEGDSIYGGTYNCEGVILYEATELGKDSQLQQIISIVQRAQLLKAPIQNLADKIASRFVPMIVLISFCTFLTWYFGISNRDMEQSLMTMCGVLVIACPCALGLATPTGIMVGGSRAAEKGILFRGGEQIEKLNKVTDIVFDKTGTLTTGTLGVIDIVTFEDFSQEQLLGYAASLEKFSNHPIAKAIINKAKEYEINKNRDGIDFLENRNSEHQIYDFQSVLGMGVSGILDGKSVLCGSRQFLYEKGINMQLLEERADIRKARKTEVCVAVDDKLCGVLGISDELRDDAKETITELKKMGYGVWMLTGDNKCVAATVAEELGINNVLAEVLPVQKVEQIQKLKKEGKRIVMVGDGINDAPALATSDISIAIGTGTAAAIEASDIILLNNQISSLIEVMIISKETMKVIYQNLLWAALYNVICIPIAACGKINPSIAAAAMSFSSIAVLLHSLRLKKAGGTKNDKNI